MYLIGLETRWHIQEPRQRQLAEENPLRGTGTRGHRQARRGRGPGPDGQMHLLGTAPGPAQRHACALAFYSPAKRRESIAAFPRLAPPFPLPASDRAGLEGGGATSSRGAGRAAGRGGVSSMGPRARRQVRAGRAAAAGGGQGAVAMETARGGAVAIATAAAIAGGGAHGRRPEGTERPEGSAGTGGAGGPGNLRQPRAARPRLGPAVALYKSSFLLMCPRGKGASASSPPAECPCCCFSRSFSEEGTTESTGKGSSRAEGVTPPSPLPLARVSSGKAAGSVGYRAPPGFAVSLPLLAHGAIGKHVENHSVE